MVNQGAAHHLKVVEGKVGLYQLRENPKGIFFIHHLKKTPHYHIESLTVIYLSVPNGISVAYTLNHGQSSFTNGAAMIKKLLVCESSIQIFKYLEMSSAWKLNLIEFFAVLDQVAVISVRCTRRSLKSACNFYPAISSLPLVKAYNGLAEVFLPFKFCTYKLILKTLV